MPCLSLCQLAACLVCAGACYMVRQWVFLLPTANSPGVQVPDAARCQAWMAGTATEGGGSSLQDTVTRSIRDFNRHHYCMKPVSPWPCRAVFPCTLFVAGVASLLLGKFQYLCCFAKCQTMSRSHPPTPCSFWWYGGVL